MPAVSQYTRPPLKPAFSVLVTYRRSGKLNPRKFEGDEMTDDEIYSIVEDAQAQITADHHFAMAEAADLLGFARLIAAAEREACARVCEEWRAGCDNRSMQQEGWAASECASAIRQRSSLAASYAAANPLGGPASMFETIASRLRAGEDYQAVLDNYGVRVDAPGQIGIVRDPECGGE